MCDKNGNTITNTSPFQSFSVQTNVSGQGELIGANIPRIEVANQKTEGGIGYGIVRTSKKAGKIIITAQSEGLKSAKAIIKSISSNENFAADGNHFVWTSEKEKNTIIEEKNLSPELIKIPVSPADVTVSDSDDAETSTNLVDGSLNTIWKSKKRLSPYVININLKEPYNLQGHKINWGKDSDWYTYSVEISSDGNNWISVLKNNKVSGQDYKPVLYNYKELRYIRFSVVNVYPENSNLAIGEIELYGKVNVK